MVCGGSFWFWSYCHAYYVVAFFQIYAVYAVGGAAHGADVIFVEADGCAFVGGDEDDLVAVGDAGGYEFVSLFDVDGVDAVGADVHELAEFGFFYQAVAGGEEDVFVFFFEIAHGQHGADGFAGLESDQVADVLAAAGSAYVGNFVDLEPVDAAFVGEDENVGVGGGDEEMLDEIFVAGLHASAAGASAALHAVGGNRRALHVAGVAEGYGDLLVGNKIFENDFGGFVFDAGAALVSVEFFYFFEFFDDDFAKLWLGGEDGFVVFDSSADFFQLVGNFVDGKLGETVQLEFENGFSLARGERLFRILFGSAAGGVDIDFLAAEVGDQILAGVGAVGAGAD